MGQWWVFVTLPRMIWEALEAPVRGVMSGMVRECRVMGFGELTCGSGGLDGEEGEEEGEEER